MLDPRLQSGEHVDGPKICLDAQVAGQCMYYPNWRSTESLRIGEAAGLARAIRSSCQSRRGISPRVTCRIAKELVRASRQPDATGSSIEIHVLEADIFCQCRGVYRDNVNANAPV